MKRPMMLMSKYNCVYIVMPSGIVEYFNDNTMNWGLSNYSKNTPWRQTDRNWLKDIKREIKTGYFKVITTL